MDRQTLNVAFATQKGGSGKTAITVLVAGYLHYRLGCPLAVIDCDFPQYSLYEMRERDSRAVLENEYLKRAAYEQMRQPGRAAYPVRKCRVEQAPDMAREPGGGRLLRPALLRPAGHGELGGHPAHDRTDGLHLRPGECGQGGAGKHALLPRRAATDDAGQGDEPPEGALPFLEPSGQAGKRAGCTRSTGRWSPTWGCRCCKPASPTRNASARRRTARDGRCSAPRCWLPTGGCWQAAASPN